MSPVAIFGHIHVTTTFWALGHDPDVWKVWGQGWEKKEDSWTGKYSLHWVFDRNVT